MATAGEHRQQAEHNQRFLDAIDRDQYPDWIATVAFYKALHLVQMLFIKKGIHAGSHTRRNQALKLRFRDIWKSYRLLYSYSRLTRYRCYQAKPAEIEE